MASDQLISTTTDIATLISTDKIPVARVGSTMPYGTTPAEIVAYIPTATTTTEGKLETATDAEAIAQTATDKALTPANLAAVQTAVNVATYGAVGDGVADDTAAIQAAINTGAILGYGQTRAGRLLIRFNPGEVYVITSPINLCNMQGITLDGGSSQMGAVIFAKCAGKAAFEIIGSQSIEIRNIEVWGDIVNTPSLAFWVSRSTAPSGTNSSQVFFTNVQTYGYYTKAVYYALETESNMLNNCLFDASGGGLSAIAYISNINDLALAPDNTVLLNGSNTCVLMMFRDSDLIMDGGVATARPLYIRGSAEVTIENTYLYTGGQPNIEMDGTVSLIANGVYIEGGPVETIKITFRGGYTNVHRLALTDFSFGAPTTYSLYADDNTTLANSRFVGCTPGISGGARKPFRLYNAAACDFTGLCINDALAFDITFDTGAATYNRFHLGDNDTLTYINGAYGQDNEIKDDSAFIGRLWLDGSQGFKTSSSAWGAGPLILGAYYFWVDATGDLRIKSGAPTTDLDGAVVGDQAA